jgi:hypothetical protein
VPEGGNLGFVEALGKLGELSFGGGVGVEGVTGDVDGGGRGGGAGKVCAAGEKSGEEASEAEGGDFEEIASGT